MTKTTTLLLSTALLHSSLLAEAPKEITIEKRPFVITHGFTATVMPEKVTPLRLDAAEWEDFEIKTLAPHGSRVSKGDVLVAFDTEKIDLKLHDLRKAIESRVIEVAQAEYELSRLEASTPNELATLKRQAAEAKEEHAYFTETRRKAEEESADQSLKRDEFSLENEKEELRQLEKMYAADDLTEETEEIILERQKYMVAASEFDVRMQKLTHKRQREVLLPREAISLAEQERDTGIALANFTEEAPRKIAAMKLTLETLKTSAAREKESLAKLEADRKLFEFKAPADGWFYHGVIDKDQWDTNEAAKVLVPHGKPEPHTPFATFIPGDVKMRLVASLPGEVAGQIESGAKGVGWFAGREDREFAVKLLESDPAPGLEGKYSARFSAEWPAKASIIPASSANIELVTYEVPAAVVLPSDALKFGPTGWTVAVKLADGKTEARTVKRGRLFNDEFEILSGLEAGQVVVIP